MFVLLLSQAHQTTLVNGTEMNMHGLSRFGFILALITALLYIQPNDGLAQTVIDGTTSDFGGLDYILGSNVASSTLVITNGGDFINMSSVTIGFGAAADNNAALITGAGSTWDNAGRVTIGSEGGAEGNALTLENGAAMTSGGDIQIKGSYGSLRVTGGATMTTGNGMPIASSSGAYSNTVLVSGAGSVWNNTAGGGMTFGANSVSGNFLIVSNGASVNNLSDAGSANGDNTIIVDGPNSYLRASKAGKNFTLGGGHVIVRNGGVVDCGNTFWLFGGAITVSGANSKFIIEKELGWGGQSHTWTATDGGYIGDFRWGDVGTSNNRFICSGANSEISSRKTSSKQGDFGFNGGGATFNNLLHVSDGGSAWFGKDFSLGSASGCTNNVVTITGVGSIWTQASRNSGGGVGTPASSITIGHLSAQNNYLNVFDGGAVTVTNIYIAGASNALNLGSGTGAVARASVEVVSVELMDAGARVFMNNGMLSASDDGALVSGPGIVTNVGPAYFSVADNHLSTISSEISGPGSLTKAGLGELVLTAANTYGGDTSISNGTLSIAHAYLNDAADVYLIDGVTFDLDFAGIDVIRSLYFDGAQQPAGTYSAGRLNGTIAGTGSLRVTQSAAADGLQFLIR